MISPSEDRFRIKIPKTRKVYSGLDKLFHNMRGRLVSKSFDKKKLLEQGRRIVEKSKIYQQYDFDDLINEFSDHFKPNPDLNILLPYLCEISYRILGMRPYDVQVMGVLIISKGAIAEMATGEGKTLTAALSAVVFAAENKPVHVLTANDYLAERDAEEGEAFFRACGLRVGFVGGDTDHNKRRDIYNNHIVYTTAKELLGDFLRDRIKIGNESSDLSRAVNRVLKIEDDGSSDVVLRGLYSVIVDEADNILIDEAVIPLIISARRDNMPLREAAVAAYESVKKLVNDEDYKVNYTTRQIILTSKGEKKLKAIAEELPLMWRGRERSLELVNTALHAREFLLRDEHYIIQEGKIVLIDSLTGRLMPQRNLGINLQQAVEAKEEIEVTDPTETIGRMSFQKFFRLFPKIGGMSGTVKEVEHEIWQVYHTPVVEVPTYRKVIRKEHPWKFFSSGEKKVEAIVEDVLKRHDAGQPILLGTRSVALSEEFSELLENDVETLRVLNAVKHDEEAEIVSMAGVRNAFTVATNMAGRGTDIKLSASVHKLGGLCVVCAEPQASKRLDRQLFGRAGRQGDVGEAEMYASYDDLLIKTFLPKWTKGFVWTLFNVKVPFRNYILKNIVIMLQRRSERIFASQRMGILMNDDWIDNYLNFYE